MPRPKSPAPAYQFNVSGQAVVRLDLLVQLLNSDFNISAGSLLCYSLRVSADTSKVKACLQCFFQAYQS